MDRPIFLAVLVSGCFTVIYLLFLYVTFSLKVRVFLLVGDKTGDLRAVFRGEFCIVLIGAGLSGFLIISCSMSSKMASVTRKLDSSVEISSGDNLV